jgi:hypothetical protein
MALVAHNLRESNRFLLAQGIEPGQPASMPARAGGRDFDLRGGAMAVNRRDMKIGFDPVFLTTGERENVSGKGGTKTYFYWLKAYFTDTDHTCSNIISRDYNLFMVIFSF